MPPISFSTIYHIGIDSQVLQYWLSQESSAISIVSGLILEVLLIRGTNSVVQLTCLVLAIDVVCAGSSVINHVTKK